jgi:hypothetical protein
MLGDGAMRRLSIVGAFWPRVGVSTVVFQIKDGHDAVWQRLFEGGSLENELCQAVRFEITSRHQTETSANGGAGRERTRSPSSPL